MAGEMAEKMVMEVVRELEEAEEVARRKRGRWWREEKCI